MEVPFGLIVAQGYGDGYAALREKFQCFDHWAIHNDAAIIRDDNGT
ncbi:MAG: hypothetical protein WAN35_03510 [Terracidiphilus sp.]